MSDDIAILKEMIQSTATVSYKGTKVTLEETSSEASSGTYSVTIHGMPDVDDVIVIKADAFPALKEIFANTRHECKRADFVIIANTDEEKSIICIEMKAGRAKTSEIIQQLQGTQCFVAYCREIGRVFWEEKDFLEGYKYYFVSIRNIKTKRRIRPKSPHPLHDSPKKVLHIDSTKGLRFNHLVGRK